jgi:hypothetical protein
MSALSYFTSSIVLVFFLNVNSVEAASYIDNQDGTVRDFNTGLVWQAGDSSHDLKKSLNWYDALEYVAIKNSEKYAGSENWRLPTLKELNQLWSSKGTVLSKDDETLGLSSPFKGGGSYYIWTADERGLDHAWYFGLGHKENYFNLKDLADLEQGVKMVRSPDGSK